MTYREALAGQPGISPTFLRASVGAPDRLAGPFIAPHITPEKLQGALTFAPQARGEQPLALVDDTVMGSGKSGVLLTDRAAYFSSPRARVPIEAILHAPRFPSGLREAGVLETALGALTLPVLLDEGVTAMNRLLRAVAFFNRGGYRVSHGPAPFFGPVADAATHALRLPEVPMVPSVSMRAVHAGANVAGGWLDVDAGEELLVFLDDTGQHTGECFVAFSDRRVISHVDDERTELSYAHLTGARLETGLLGNTFKLRGPASEMSVSVIASAAVCRALTDFLVAVMRIPPELRRATPSTGPSADDPSGALAAFRSMACPDLRAVTLLELIHRSVATGAMPVDAGVDLVVRTARLQRTLRGGYGSAQGYSRTPLSASDFEAVLSSILGTATRHEMLDARTRVLGFDMGRAGSGAGTIASNVVGLTLLAVVGVGWTTTGSRGPQRVQVRVMDAAGGAGFTLHDDAGKPLAKDHAELAGRLLEASAELSAQVLLRRALLGWNLASAPLLAEPVTSLDARARALLPAVDLAPFLP
jgi:hypothetical protein